MARNDVVNSDGSINYNMIGGFKDRLDGHDASLAEIATLVSGLDKTGVTDNTTAIQNAINLIPQGGKLLLPNGTFLISSALTVPDNVTIEGAGNGTVILLANGDMTGFLVSGRTGVIIRNLKIKANIAGTTAYIGGIKLQSSSTYCLVENVTFDGLSWTGVMIDNSHYNLVKGCTFVNWKGTIGDSSDVCIFHTSNYNRIEGNNCYGGGEHGIFIQDPYTNDTPTGNIVIGNHVGQHRTYGIIVYVTTAYDTKTVVANNVVKDILGSTGGGGSSGAGIYIQSAGGTIVTGNQVSNCCQQTSNFETNGIGHITVAIGTYGTGTLTEVIVSNNHINATRGPGIFCTTSNKGIIVQGNTILVTGTTAVRGEGIYAINCQYLKLLNNIIRQSNTNYQGININAGDGFTMLGTEVCDNTVDTVAYGIAFNVVGSGTFTDSIIKGNHVFNGNNTALSLLKITNALVSNNNCQSTAGYALVTNGCPKMRLTGNYFYSPIGGSSILFLGTSTGSIVDESNSLNGTVQNNSGSGVIISQYGSAAPAGSGSWNVGDRVIQSVPAVGSPKGWRCTVAGNPGTWTSEGNL